ncbi:two-component sensor histidine kinase [Sphingobium lactosutens]|uniref:sensor histidine kinase n=1 Tax=Sphingobium lactosutens TaxID=522773 RepID=UPI0015BA3604|nr:ATP-binding protein [Sphingobium lactosutens]NWK99033.1 two-component sensor histidine kinase [Sphingobium lactosutens]
MFMPRTIKGLSILSASISGLVILAVAAAAIFISHHEIEAQIDHRLELEMDALFDYHATGGSVALARLVRMRDGAGTYNTGYLADRGQDGRLMLYALADADGRRIAGNLIPHIPPSGWTEFLPIRRPDGSKGVAQALSRRLPDGGQIVIAGDRDALRRADDRILMAALMGLGVILLTGTVSTIGFGRLVRRRLVLISGTAQGIIEGDYTRRIPIDGSGSEFDRISIILNTMLGRIDILMRSLRQVSSDIAHDMRTPLGRIRRDMEVLLLSGLDGATTDILERTIADMDALLDLFAGLLGVSEVQGLAARKRFIPLRLSEIVGEIVEAYRPAFDDENRTISVSLSDVAVWGDAQLLKRAVANMLENILAHAGDGADAMISLDAGDDEAVLIVSDNGSGIAAEDRERVFERLVRLDPARSKPGHGLGLSMVRAIVHAHRGTIEIMPSEVGLKFQIRIPAVMTSSHKGYDQPL